MTPGESDPNLHRMPAVHWLPGGQLRAGQMVVLDYYALVPVYDGTAASCLTHPAVAEYMRQNIQAVDHSNGGFPGYLLSYDEMRTGHTCELCAQHGATAGELLAAHLRNSTTIAQSIVGRKKPLWIWDDMYAATECSFTCRLCPLAAVLWVQPPTFGFGYLSAFVRLIVHFLIGSIPSTTRTTDTS
eukprot:COSAG01_NODE_6851_length_3469_cov_7.973294_2_plen_186_part_00